ncbi:unnamed protein product [Cuscuta campestris]|uniref:Retrotransposon Copia-like N-terminal domain-containing protein n=1 Tax=Cuscuta campestris TaxID=132261 RepID=A0A484KUW4_9ASTE|nr:unnamed protein product [Cuscuta campestris]
MRGRTPFTVAAAIGVPILRNGWDWRKTGGGFLRRWRGDVYVSGNTSPSIAPASLCATAAATASTSATMHAWSVRPPLRVPDYLETAAYFVSRLPTVLALEAVIPSWSSRSYGETHRGKEKWQQKISNGQESILLKDVDKSLHIDDFGMNDDRQSFDQNLRQETIFTNEVIEVDNNDDIGSKYIEKRPLKDIVSKVFVLPSEKLTDSNYPAWSLNVKTALEANLLLGWIDGHEAAPPKILSKDGKENPNPEFQTWIVIDTQIRACLLAVISPSVHKHVRNFTTSADLWNALAARYNSVSTAHIYQLWDKLHTLRKGTKTITQYLDEVATTLTDLDALNEIPPPEFLTLHCIQTAIEAAVEEDRTVDRFLGEDLDPVAAVEATEGGEAADLHAIFQYVRSVQSVATLLLPASTAMMILLLRATRLPILVLCMQPQATKLVIGTLIHVLILMLRMIFHSCKLRLPTMALKLLL